MNTSRSSITAPQQVEADQQAVHRLTDLIVGVRAVAEHADWAVTVRLVADQLRAQLPSPDVLTPEQRRGSPDDYCGHILYVEPDGSFSIVALVWRAGQCTRIHDHVTWCVFGVIQGAEHEELFDSIHIYGTDITRIGSSARRYYN